MGMSIDNSIRLLEDYLEWQKLHDMDGTGIDEATRNLIDVAKKYQKIKEIIQHWIDEDLASESPSFADSGTIEDIIEVIKDGNDE